MDVSLTKKQKLELYYFMKLNRSLEDTLFLGRAHSLGWRRQQVEMLGWALMVNALTMARHRAADGLEAAFQAAVTDTAKKKVTAIG